MINHTSGNDISLEHLSQLMPGAYFWKKNRDSVYTDINQDCAALFGFNKKKTMIGFTDEEIPCRIAEFADLFRQQDKTVMTSGAPLRLLEMHHCAKNQLKIMLNTKNPLRDPKNKIIGTFAYCLDITKQVAQIKSLLTAISATEGSFILHQKNNDLDLTTRQMDCLFYLLRGKTSKETAAILGLSSRTIEYYIIQLKNKFSCHTKSELVDFAINKGLLNVIPSCLSNQYDETGSHRLE